MPYDIIVTGQVSADLIPDLTHMPLRALASPGKLFEVGSLTITTGGGALNTGLALHRLGANVGLMSAVGADWLGEVLLSSLREHDPRLADLISVRPGEVTCYSIILSPGDGDRIILTCPGSNANFDHTSIDFEIVRGAKLFHLGYPPLLPRLYADDGDSLLAIYRRIHELGVVTSLDMVHPDPNAASGRVDWARILKRVLPYVDIFLPSIEEIVFMLRRADYDRWGGRVLQHMTHTYLRELTDELLTMGVMIAGLKLGAYGFFLKTVREPVAFERLQRLGLVPDQWRDFEAWHPAFQVNVAGGIGAGDCAYAGFLAALLRGLPPAEALRMACAVGACNVEAADSISGIRSWSDTIARIERGWAALPLTLPA